MAEMSPLERRDGKLVIYWRDDFRKVGLGFARWGAVAAGPGAAAGLVGWDRFMLLGVLGFVLFITAAVFCVVGLLFWAVSRSHTLVDPEGELVFLSDGRMLPFSDLVAVHLTSYVHVQSGKGGGESERFQVQLVTAKADPEAVSQLQALRGALDEALADGEAGLSGKENEGIQVELNRLAPILAGASELVADHPGDLATWRAAERLARMMDLPLMDLSGEELLLRTPAELDLSVTRRLQLQDKAPPDPGPAPAEMDAGIHRGVLEVTWETPDMLVFLTNTLGIVAAVVVAVLLLSGAATPALPLILAVVMAGLLAPGMVRLVTRPRHLLHLDADGVLMKPARGKEGRIPLPALEAVRVSTTLQSTVLFLSDDEALRCVLKDEAQARWLGAAAEHLISRLGGSAGQGPYR